MMPRIEFAGFLNCKSDIELQLYLKKQWMNSGMRHGPFWIFRNVKPKWKWGGSRKCWKWKRVGSPAARPVITGLVMTFQLSIRPLKLLKPWHRFYRTLPGHVRRVSYTRLDPVIVSTLYQKVREGSLGQNGQNHVIATPHSAHGQDGQMTRMRIPHTHRLVHMGATECSPLLKYFVFIVCAFS